MVNANGCYPECSPGETKCANSNTSFQICDLTGQWEEQDHCTLGCNATNGCHECSSNDRECSGSTIYKTCVDGFWHSQTCTAPMYHGVPTCNNSTGCSYYCESDSTYDYTPFTSPEGDDYCIGILYSCPDNKLCFDSGCTYCPVSGGSAGLYDCHDAYGFYCYQQNWCDNGYNGYSGCLLLQ